MLQLVCQGVISPLSWGDGVFPITCCARGGWHCSAGAGWVRAAASTAPAPPCAVSGGAGRAGDTAGDQMAAAHAGEFLRAALWPLTPVLLSQLLWRRSSSWFNTAHWFWVWACQVFLSGHSGFLVWGLAVNDLISHEKLVELNMGSSDVLHWCQAAVVVEQKVCVVHWSMVTAPLWVTWVKLVLE